MNAIFQMMLIEKKHTPYRNARLFALNATDVRSSNSIALLPKITQVAEALDHFFLLNKTSHIDDG